MDGQGIVVAGDRSLTKDPVLTRLPEGTAKAIEAALMLGDLKGLSTEHRIAFYNAVCESVGLNPLTRPLEYIVLNGRLTMYARKDATDQLRALHAVSINVLSRETVDGSYVVRARAVMPDGRQDESIGAVDLTGLKGQERANGMMKAETKAKRRVTLSICGLGYLDESELEDKPRPRMRYVTEEPEAVACAQIAESNSPAASEGSDAEKQSSPTIEGDIKKNSAQAAGECFDDDDIADVRKACARSSFDFDQVVASLASKGLTTFAVVKKADKPKLIEWIESKAPVKRNQGRA